MLEGRKIEGPETSREVVKSDQARSGKTLI